MTSVARWVEVHRLAVAGRLGSQNRIDAVKRDVPLDTVDDQVDGDRLRQALGIEHGS
jgi:hypothetical protein